MSSRQNIGLRHDLIKKLANDGQIHSYKKLQELLSKRNCDVSIRTVSNDLKALNIFYNPQLKRFTFQETQTPSTITLLPDINPELREVLYNCGLGSSQYKIYIPMYYSHSKDYKTYIMSVLITCKLGYENVLHQSISKHFSSYNIISFQINSGSIVCLFSLKKYANDFYKDFKEQLLLIPYTN